MKKTMREQLEELELMAGAKEDYTIHHNIIPNGDGIVRTETYYFDEKGNKVYCDIPEKGITNITVNLM